MSEGHKCRGSQLTCFAGVGLRASLWLRDQDEVKEKLEVQKKGLYSIKYIGTRSYGTLTAYEVFCAWVVLGTSEVLSHMLQYLAH